MIRPLDNLRAVGSGGRYLLQVVKGQLPNPGKPITGTVTSDTNCDADVQGLSHCNNNITLPNGSEILVIDTHNMHRNRCLGPGDQLKLTAVGKSWVMGTLAGQYAAPSRPARGAPWRRRPHRESRLLGRLDFSHRQFAARVRGHEAHLVADLHPVQRVEQRAAVRRRLLARESWLIGLVKHT